MAHISKRVGWEIYRDKEWSLDREALDLLGYSAPLPLMYPERAAAVVSEHMSESMYTRNPHARLDSVLALLSDPALVAAVEGLCGKGLRLWRSAFFRKGEGSSEIGWHHDKHFFADDADDIRLEEMGSHFSVLLGLTDITQMTGLLQVIPGSHRPIDGFDRDVRPYHKRPSSEHIIAALPNDLLSRVRSVPIAAGSFLVFHSAILHRSLPHFGGMDRLGLAIRLVRPGLEVPLEMASPLEVVPFPPLGL